MYSTRTKNTYSAGGRGDRSEENLRRSLTTQADHRCGETENDASTCDSTVRVDRDTVTVHSDVSTTRVVLHSTQTTGGFQESPRRVVAAFFFFFLLSNPNPRECCYQKELVRLNWVVKKNVFPRK